MYTLEYTDGYYIAKDGEGVIDLAEPENREFAEFVVNALNAAQQPLAHRPACTCAKKIAFIDHGDWLECMKCGGAGG